MYMCSLARAFAQLLAYYTKCGSRSDQNLDLHCHCIAVQACINNDFKHIYVR